MNHHQTFTTEQIETVNQAVAAAEDLVSNFFKMSSNQWLHGKYDVKTRAQLKPEETVEGPFAQVIRYQGQRKDTSLGSASYDFYKICLQDHSILTALADHTHIRLYPFTLYIVAHELIHIVRFSKFLQSFEATADEKLEEERRVHEFTRTIIKRIKVAGIAEVLGFYRQWTEPVDDLAL